MCSDHLELSIKLTPRDWQSAALDRWQANGMHGIASVVTGGGKTAFAFFCLEQFLRRHKRGEVLVIVPTTALLDQWYVAFQDEAGIPSEHIAVYSGLERTEVPRRISISVINTARTGSIPVSSDIPTFLIVDECHRAGSPVNSRALEGDYAATLGLSATPRREHDSGFDDYLVPRLGPIIFEYDYEQAHIDGVISRFDLINVRIDLLEAEQTRYDALSKRIAIEMSKLGPRDENDKLKSLLLLRASIANSAIMRVPVTAKLVDVNVGKRLLIFHERIDSAEAILDILRKRNHSATIYHSQVAPSIRRDNLRLYRRGVFDVLVTCRALDEGFNVPETEVAIVASSTSSVRQRIQRLGRVLRPSKEKEKAEIYTVYATDVEERRLLKEAASLGEISSINWVKVTVDNNG